MDIHQSKLKNKHLAPKQEKYFQEVFDFHRLIKVKENRDQTERFDAKVDTRKKLLRDPLEMRENVLVLAERWRKNGSPGRLYKKSTTEN